MKPTKDSRVARVVVPAQRREPTPTQLHPPPSNRAASLRCFSLTLREGAGIRDPHDWPATPFSLFPFLKAENTGSRNPCHRRRPRDAAYAGPPRGKPQPQRRRRGPRHERGRRRGCGPRAAAAPGVLRRERQVRDGPRGGRGAAARQGPRRCRLRLRPRATGQELHPQPGTARDGASLVFFGVRASVVRSAARVSALFFLRYMAGRFIWGSVRTFES